MIDDLHSKILVDQAEIKHLSELVIRPLKATD
jgi:hypothetical protein